MPTTPECLRTTIQDPEALTQFSMNMANWLASVDEEIKVETTRSTRTSAAQTRINFNGKTRHGFGGTGFCWNKALTSAMFLGGPT